MFEGQRASGGPGLDLLDLLEVRGPPPTMKIDKKSSVFVPLVDCYVYLKIFSDAAPPTPNF